MNPSSWHRAQLGGICRSYRAWRSQAEIEHASGYLPSCGCSDSWSSTWSENYLHGQAYPLLRSYSRSLSLACKNLAFQWLISECWALFLCTSPHQRGWYRRDLPNPLLLSSGPHSWLMLASICQPAYSQWRYIPYRFSGGLLPAEFCKRNLHMFLRDRYCFGTLILINKVLLVERTKINIHHLKSNSEWTNKCEANQRPSS